MLDLGAADSGIRVVSIGPGTIQRGCHAALYWENTYDFFGVKGVAIPAAVSVFPNEIYKAPRSWAERAYSDLIYFNEVDRGCHFAAWQEPALFSSELRAAFRPLR